MAEGAKASGWGGGRGVLPHGHRRDAPDGGDLGVWVGAVYEVSSSIHRRFALMGRLFEGSMYGDADAEGAVDRRGVSGASSRPWSSPNRKAYGKEDSGGVRSGSRHLHRRHLALGNKPGQDGGPEYSAKKLIELYETEGGKLRPCVASATQRGGLRGGEISLDGHRGGRDKVLRGCPPRGGAKEVLVTAYEIEKRGPWFFKRRHAQARRKASTPL